MTDVAIDLEGDVAVVTGGSRGIGRAIAETFADAGADVVPVARSEDALADAVEAVQDRGARSLLEPTDVTDVDAVDDLFAAVEADLGGVDVLVNNAGINPLASMGTPESLEPDAFRDPIEVNLMGAYNCTHRAGQALLDAEGAVINLASTAGLRGVKRQHGYVASKHAMVGLTRSTAMDWAPAVRVNAIAPGYVATELTAPLEEMDELYEKIVDRTPAGRFGEPEEVASVAAFLASDHASFMTGACVVVDGGIILG